MMESRTPQISSSKSTPSWVHVAIVDEIPPDQCKVVQAGGHTLAIARHGDQFFAIDNRCPHMGFPLHRGSLCDGILTCHWHHARFDLCSGGTFDLWADDVQAYPLQIRDNQIWVDVTSPADQHQHHLERLRVGLEQNIPLVIGKSALALVASDQSGLEPFRVGLDFGTRYRSAGWGAGLTVLTCLQNILPSLEQVDRTRAMYHGVSAVARDCMNFPPRFPVQPLPKSSVRLDVMKRWFRQFIEVRDVEGAERCVVSAIRAGATSEQMADILFAAVTDHRFIDTGHTLDFTNKAFEALDHVGWESAEFVLTSLIRQYAQAQRMEESSAWRRPVDLIAILTSTFGELPAAIEQGRKHQGQWKVNDTFVLTLLSENPHDIVAAMLEALSAGCSPTVLAGCVVQAATLRIAQFPTSNEFTDWDSALHTFTFANAVQQGLRRSSSIELLRGVFDAAMSVYLDRFLNVPAVSLPQASQLDAKPERLLADLRTLLDQRGQVDAAAKVVVEYAARNEDLNPLLATLGGLLLREDRDFHTIQMVEASIRRFTTLPAKSPERVHVLIAAIRYLAAHAPTLRAQEQTWRIAYRLHHGEKMFDSPH